MNRINRRSRLLSILAAAVCLASGCAAAPEPPPAAEASLSIGRCLETIERATGPAGAACPGFLLEPLRSALQTCREAGGTLVAKEPADIRAIDVDADGRPEFAFEYDGVVACENAWSLFSCGSLGCPKTLYAERAGAWTPIAALYAESLDAIELTDRRGPEGYRDLRVGCDAGRPCPEYWTYVWRDGVYQQTSVEVHGFRVDFAGSIHGLHPLAADTPILATPTPDAAVLGRYDAGTEVAVIGTAENGDYYYVSPCNACESGFAPTSAVQTLP